MCEIGCNLESPKLLPKKISELIFELRAINNNTAQIQFCNVFVFENAFSNALSATLFEEHCIPYVNLSKKKN